MNDADLNEDIQQYPINSTIMAYETFEHIPEKLDNKLQSNVIENDSLKDMAVITCHFNWCNYKNPAKHLNNFLNRMEADNIPVYGVELSLTDTFITKNRKNWKHIKVGKDNICFQKEACINLMEKEIPENFTKIAWVDADLFFTNKNWYEDTSNALNQYKIVQMYERGKDTDQNGNIFRTVHGIVSIGGPQRSNINAGFPGGALAARRDFFQKSKLYPFSFMGAGDTILMCAIYDIEYTVEKETSSIKYKEWKKNLQQYINKDEISYVKGDFIHDWHGDKQNRDYYGRRNILNKLDIDKDVLNDSNGLISIKSGDGSFYDEIFQYFKNRLEDGIPISEINVSAKKQDMAVLSVHFNWSNFDTPVKNLNRFILEMETEDIPLFGIELSLTGKFDTERNPNWIKMKVDKKNICFQKEACINLLEKHIPSKYTKIAWIDHDVYFKNRNWYNEASEKLENTKVIQLFSEKISTDKFGFDVSVIPSLMKAGDPILETKTKKYLGTPGVALAARRELWRNGGLYPFSILGGGDSVFMYSIYDYVHTNPIVTACAGITKPFNSYNSWKESIIKYVNRSCSYIKGDVVHSWHGDILNRRYDDRYSIISDIDWNKSVRLNKYGIIEIVNVEDYVYYKIKNYFDNRNEDGNDI